MKKRAKEPYVPAERHETIRREIMEALKGHTVSAKEISAEVGIREKEVSDHLEHIQRSLHKESRCLLITPAECKKCGFVFRKRERLSKPGKCPACKSESIQEPLFSIKRSSFNG